MSAIPTKSQTSAGGVAFRKRGGRVCVALISVGDEARWQLPKGRVAKRETNEMAAQREVREEAGVETRLIGLIDKIEYWFYSTSARGRVRIHKAVHLYLLQYVSGDVRDHDHEVNEARWFEIDEALEILTFDSERRMVARAKKMIADL